MARLFEEHIRRKVKSLDGPWKFRTDPDESGMEAGWYKKLPKAETVLVPSVWNSQSKYFTYSGVAWYEKEFYSTGGCLRFCFGAVMTEAEVWLDGQHIGSHYGGFLQFALIANEVEEGWHKLTVKVSNQFNEQSVPQEIIDWYNHGGITRGVTVETLEGLCILTDRLEYQLSENLQSVNGKFVLEVYNGDAKKKVSAVTIHIGTEKVYVGSLELPGHTVAEIVTPEFNLKEVTLWDTENPKLYPISILTDTDDLQDRVGFRKIEIKDKKILLNHRAVELRGVNRHEEHPECGFAFPPNLMKRDLDIAIDMGCNALRGSHYPNTQEFVDLLDENGILFWSEVEFWGGGFKEDRLQDPVIVERGFRMHQDVVRYYYNHPSIIIWSMHNEVLCQTQAAYELTKKYYEFLKANGGNRLITYATNNPLEDICTEFCDVVCCNLYYGWYWDDIKAWDAAMQKVIERKNERGFFDKPMIMSEFGGAAVYGAHDHEDMKGSEEYQAKLLSYCVRLFHQLPEVVGYFIWQFCDTRTSFQSGTGRPRGFNNKGVLNEYRKPKLAYTAIQKLYKEFAEEA